MDLIIRNRLIKTPVEEILAKVQTDNPNSYLRDIRIRGSNLSVTCPFHKSGSENHPSCGVYRGGGTDTEEQNLTVGHYHCFTCGASGSLARLVGYCFGQSTEWGREWLVENYGSTFVEDIEVLDFSINTSNNNVSYLDESVLEQYNEFHPYISSRRISKEVAAKFKIGYDRATKCITFPTWDEKGNLVAINRRSVEGKNYILDKGRDKPVYLLNFLLKDGVDSNVWVCESQINALTLHTYGLKAVALMGTGNQYQYNILNKTDIKNYILALDPDRAGMMGTWRFWNNINHNCMVSVIELPHGQDINDVSYEQFLQCPVIDIHDWIQKNLSEIQKLI